jgi:hypothetical protein
VPLDSPTGQDDRDVTNSLRTETKPPWHSKSNNISVQSIFRQVSAFLYETSCQVVDINDNGDVLKINETRDLSCTNSSTTINSTFETSSLSSRVFELWRHSQYAPHPDRPFLVRAVWRTLYNVWTQPFILFLILLQTAVLVVDTTEWRPYTRDNLFTLWGPWTGPCYLVIFFFYTGEFVCKGAVHWFGRENATTFQSRLSLRNLFNALDFVAIISFWINFIMMMLVGTRESRFHQILAMLSALRILRLLRITAGTDSETTVIFEALKESGRKLGKVALFICFFWLLFAVVGIQTFKSSLKRSCVLPNTGSTDMNMAFRGQA